MNTVEVKRGVFDDVVAGELSNLAARHKLEGLRYPGSAAACAPLTDPYFEVAEDVWARLSTEMALQAINGLYPSWDISPEGLARADRFLARDLPSGLRRAVSEERSRVERALRNRGVDAA